MSKSLSILHCLRAPVGGLFRHVCDLAQEQSSRGHGVGIVCDAARSDDAAEDLLKNLDSNICKFGVKRVPMSRQIGPRDFAATRAVAAFARSMNAEIMHGHGAKGGAYARLAARRAASGESRPATFYTPHGGSLHYDPKSIQGRIFMSMERFLGKHTDGLIFESQYSSRIYEQNVGPFPCAVKIIPNGLRPREFEVAEPVNNAADFLYVGELRLLKGVDTLLEALSSLQARQGVSVFIAGEGPDAQHFRKMADDLGISSKVNFAGHTPARHAFTQGRCIVVPSRAESFPYIVLEAAAAGVPIISTDVGGIPEIMSGSDTTLIAADNVSALTDAMGDFLEDPAEYRNRAARLQKIVSSCYTVQNMVDEVTGFYSDIAGQA